MQESVENCIVHCIEHQEDLTYIINSLGDAIIRPDSPFIPITSFKVTHEKTRFQVEIETKGAYLLLKDVSVVALTVRQLCEVVRKVLECAAYAETLGLSALPLRFLHNFADVRINPLITHTEAGEEIEEVLRQVLGKGRAGRTHPAALSALLNQINTRIESASQLSDLWPNACISAAISSLSQLNEAAKMADWETAQDLLDWNINSSLRVAICMSNNCICPQAPQALVWTCSLHCFGSETCRYGSSITSECPLCASHRLSIRESTAETCKRTAVLQICPCGREFLQNKSEGWRLSLLGSDQYESAMKCCSEDCFVHFFSQNPLISPIETPEFDPNMCLECLQPLALNSYETWFFPCKYHGFCSTRCRLEFMRLYTSRYLIILPCLFCTQELLSMAAGNYEKYEEVLKEMENLQHAVLSSRTEQAATELMLLYSEIKALIYEGKGPRDTRPLYLSLKKLEDVTWLLACCVCHKPTSVHKYLSSDSFLVSCEFKIHSICSSACANRLGSVCLLCPDARIAHIVSSPCETTKAALQISPAAYCVCNQSITSYDLPECAHSVCLQCFANSITEIYANDSLYLCPICLKKYHKAALMAKVFT